VVLTYIDASVALAHLCGEPRAPGASFWQGPKVSSRLLDYEIWNRLHAHSRAETHGARARELLAGIELLDLSDSVLARALRAFPIPVRTLDGMHLATIEFLRSGGEAVELASYDRRLIAAAGALGLPVAAI
jgi:hypothetical protein